MKGSVFAAHKYDTPYLPAKEDNAFPLLPHTLLSKLPSWPEVFIAKSKGII